MARSLTLAGGFLITLLVSGCGLLPHTKTGPQRLNDVLTTQQQANTAYQSGEMERAAAFYLQLTKMIPQEAEYWYMLGNTYVRTQHPDEAVQAYQQAIARNPNHTRAWHNLGIVRMRQAMAAFVSSASTAKSDDPMYGVSTRLADQLARIGSSDTGKPEDQVATAAPLPFTTAERLDPLARVQHVRTSKPTAGNAAGTAVSPGTAAARSTNMRTGTGQP